MVVNEVYCTPIATTSTIVLFMSKTFFSCHLFNKDGEGSI
jgi:hypothetical protein